jgi:hypothetical protein
VTRERSLKHGHKTDYASTPELKAWQHAKSRCFNPDDPKYPRYGGRGITMCEEWAQNFQAFFDHIGPKPYPSYLLDRINNNGHYEPGNVRWVDARTSVLNRGY